jgi:competence protein ComEC
VQADPAVVTITGAAVRGSRSKFLAIQIEASLLRKRRHLLPWAPVALGAGIGTYFSVSTELSVAVWSVVVAIGLASALAARIVRQAFAPVALGLMLIAVGGALAGVRTWTVAAPVLSFRYYGPIEGRIVEIDRSASDTLRLALDHIVLEAVAPERTPERVRVSLRGD